MKGTKLKSIRKPPFQLHSASSARTFLCLALAAQGVWGPDAFATSVRTVQVNDTNWFFSPYNWYIDGSAFAQSQYPGAYFTVAFSGTQAALTLDLSPLDSVPASSWPRIRWQLDNNPPQDHQTKKSDSQIQLNSEALQQGPHSLTVWLVAADVFQDRWLVPAESLRVTGIVIDADAYTLPPPQRARRIVFFGDSIAEGIATECEKDKVLCQDATRGYAYASGLALNAEFGVVGLTGQGWAVSVDPLANVPPFPAAWNCQFAGQPRSFVPAPDYVVVVHGANDALFGALATGGVAKALQAWIGNARAVLRKSKIFVVVPFGGYERDELTQGFNAYQAAAHDRNAYLIDLGPEAEVGLNSGGFVKGGTAESYDGVHPTAARSAELGAMLAQAIQETLSK